MATSAVAGYKGVIKFSTSTGGTLRTIAEIKNFNINTVMNPIDVTSHDSSGQREIIAGVGSWSGTADGLYVIGSTWHKAVFDMLTAKTKADMEFWPTGSSSDGAYGGTAYFTNWELTSPNEDALAKNISFDGTSVLVRSSSST